MNLSLHTKIGDKKNLSFISFDSSTHMNSFINNIQHQSFIDKLYLIN